MDLTAGDEKSCLYKWGIACREMILKRLSWIVNLKHVYCLARMTHKT